MKKRGLWDTVREEISEAVFPSNIYCIKCGSLIDRTRLYSLCDSCMKTLHWIGPHTCEKCGKALPDTYKGRLCYDCMMFGHYFSRGFSCLTYGLHERGLILDYKYNGRGYLGGKFGDILYDRIACEDISADVIIPVPVGRKRLAKRGYNQAALMAARLSERWGVPMDEDVLFRQKETPLLRSLSPAQRQDALYDAFSVRDAKKPELKGKCILLVDDIYTTGATVDACSRTLIENGAGDVFVLTLASGGNRKPNIE